MDPRDVKTAREKEVQYLFDMEVYEYSTEAGGTGANRTRPSRPQVDRYQQRKCRGHTLPFASGVYGGASQRGGTDLLGNTSAGNFANPDQCACQDDVFRVEDPFLISIADVSRTHFCGDAVRDVCVRLPDEDTKAKQPGLCGKLRKTMYGSLDAAQRWREHYAQVLETGGFSRGVAPPSHLFHKGLGTYILLRGHNFFIVGRQEGREYALSLLRGA